MMVVFRFLRLFVVGRVRSRVEKVTNIGVGEALYLCILYRIVLLDDVVDRYLRVR